MPYPKKRASELMECGQRMQQGQGQGIHRIEYLYCGVTRTCLEKHKELVLEQALITPKLILKRVFGKDTEMRTLLGTMQMASRKWKHWRYRLLSRHDQTGIRTW